MLLLLEFSLKSKLCGKSARFERQRSVSATARPSLRGRDRDNKKPYIWPPLSIKTNSKSCGVAVTSSGEAIVIQPSGFDAASASRRCLSRCCVPGWNQAHDRRRSSDLAYFWALWALIFKIEGRLLALHKFLRYWQKLEFFRESKS